MVFSKKVLKEVSFNSQNDDKQSRISALQQRLIDKHAEMAMYKTLESKENIDEMSGIVKKSSWDIKSQSSSMDSLWNYVVNTIQPSLIRNEGIMSKQASTVDNREDFAPEMWPTKSKPSFVNLPGHRGTAVEDVHSRFTYSDVATSYYYPSQDESWWSTCRIPDHIVHGLWMMDQLFNKRKLKWALWRIKRK